MDSMIKFIKVIRVVFITIDSMSSSVFQADVLVTFLNI